MGFVGYLVILAVFLGISWFIRLMVSQNIANRVDRKVAEDKAGFCTWPRELSEEK
jgi:hypothetical protein